MVSVHTVDIQVLPLHLDLRGRGLHLNEVETNAGLKELDPWSLNMLQLVGRT